MNINSYSPADIFYCYSLVKNFHFPCHLPGFLLSFCFFHNFPPAPRLPLSTQIPQLIPVPRPIESLLLKEAQRIQNRVENVRNVHTSVIGDGRIKAGAEVGELSAVKVGGLGQSLLILLMQLSHQQQLRVQLVHLQTTQSAGYLVSYLMFNSTFSTNRLYPAIQV